MTATQRIFDEIARQPMNAIELARIINSTPQSVRGLISDLRNKGVEIYTVRTGKNESVYSLVPMENTAKDRLRRRLREMQPDADGVFAANLPDLKNTYRLTKDELKSVLHEFGFSPFCRGDLIWYKEVRQ